MFVNVDAAKVVCAFATAKRIIRREAFVARDNGIGIPINKGEIFFQKKSLRQHP